MAEIELKLKAPADRLPALRDALATMTGARPAPETLTATYYDSRGRDLVRHGFTLRVRRENDAYVQTVKSAGRTLLKRGEWSDPLPDGTPDLSAKATGRRVRRLLRSRVRPQFKVDVNRTAFTIHAGENTLIEAAVDEGTIRAPGKDTPQDRVAEVELELKSGDPAALYSTALKLMQVAPLTIETRSKSARGYALAQDKLPVFVKITPFEVKRKMSLDEVLHAAGIHYLTQCLRNTPAVLADSVEGVHQMRVALRRLRALLNCLKKEMPEQAYDWANGHLKQVLQTLGPARNWDVFVEDTVGAVAAEGHLAQGSAFLRAANIARMRAHLQARDAVASPAHTTSLLELLRWFETRGWRAGKGAALESRIEDRAGKLIDRQFRRARKRGKNFERLTTDERHEFRIAAKSLRYTLDLLSPVVGAARVKRLIDTLKPLQDRLGHLNDVSTAETLLAELTKQDPSPAVALQGGIVLGWHQGRLRAGERRLCKMVADVRDAKPFW